MAKTGEKVALSLTEVQWKGSMVPIKNQQVRVALIKLNQTIAEVGREENTEEKMRLYEQLLMDCQDAVQMIRDELNQEKVVNCIRSICTMFVDKCLYMLYMLCSYMYLVHCTKHTIHYQTFLRSIFSF